MFKKLLLVLLIVMAMPMLLYGQSVGKITGVATDESNGEPLPGVNVIIEGTTMGAATDIDGYYVILNVPVGTYSLRSSYIGYKDIVVENVRVSAGITTQMNFKLEPTSLELEEAVLVTAERPLVEKNVTQSISIVTSEDLKNIPIRSFNALVQIQNSVVVQDGNIHIRGGRPDEVGYYIDGAATVDPLTNTQSLHVIKEAIEEFQVLAGGYTAEFGGANSGIIRTELKTGSPDYHFSLGYQMDGGLFADKGEKFLGTYTYKHYNTVATVSGPLISKNVRFFAAGENYFKGDRDVRFSKGFSFENLVDENSGEVIPEYAYPDGYTPNRLEDQWAGQGTMLFDFTPIRFRLSGSWSDRSRRFNSFRDDISSTSRPTTPMLNVLNDRYFEDVFSNLLLSGKLTYVLSPSSLLEANVNFFNSKLDREDSYFGNEWWKWFDSTAVAQHTGGDVQYTSRWTPEEDYLINGIPFARNGDPYRSYRIQKENYLGGALNYITQLGRHHEVKVGGDYRGYTVRRFSITAANTMGLVGSAADKAGIDPYTYLQDSVNVLSWVANGVNNYGYDVYGNEADDDKFIDIPDPTDPTKTLKYKVADGPKKPIFASFYIQDKIEYNDLIINAGLRFDYFDPDSRKLKNPESLTVDQKTSQILDENWQDVDAFQQLSPRLGFSYPVSEKTVFYMQYGKFIQMPQLNTMYAGTQRYNYEYVASSFSFQNPSGYGLEPIRTTSYEIGFRQQLGPAVAFDITGFYRNVKGQVQVIKNSGVPYTFNILVNSDFATTKGLEFRLTMRRINRLQAQLNYTLAKAEGTASTSTSHIAAVEQATERPNVINPLDYSQTHRGSISLDYRFGNRDGGPILQNLGANFILSFNSGHPYTFSESQVGQADAYNSGVNYMLDPRSRVALEEVGHSTTPFNFNVDFRLDKTINLWRQLQATVYMRVLNLFNIKNVVNVYNATGNAEDDGFYNNRNVNQRNSYLETYGQEWLDMYEAINITNGQAYWDEIAQELYGNPRQIFFGIEFNY